MFKERARSVQAISLFVDSVVLAIAYLAALMLRTYHEQIPLLRELEVFPGAADRAVSAEYALILIATVVAWIAYMSRCRVYVSGDSERPGRRSFGRLGRPIRERFGLGPTFFVV